MTKIEARFLTGETATRTTIKKGLRRSISSIKIEKALEIVASLLS